MFTKTEDVELFEHLDPLTPQSDVASMHCEAVRFSVLEASSAEVFDIHSRSFPVEVLLVIYLILI